MKKYENMDNFYERKHTVEITLQLGEYKGTLKMQVRGNCFGLDILNCVDLETTFEDEFIENNCNFRLIGEDDDGNEWFRCVLKSDAGEECFCEDLLSDANKMIVKLEIVDCDIIK